MAVDMTCLGSKQRAGQLLELGRSYRVITTSLGQTSAEVVVEHQWWGLRLVRVS